MDKDNEKTNSGQPRKGKSDRGPGASSDNDQVILQVIQNLMKALSLLKTESLRRSARNDLSCLALLKEAGRLGGLKEFDSKSAFIGANIVRQDASLLCGTEVQNNSTQAPKPGMKPGKVKVELDQRSEKPTKPAQAPLSKKVRLPAGADVLERNQPDLFKTIIEQNGDGFLAPLYKLKEAYSTKEATIEVDGKQQVWQAIDYCFLKKRSVYNAFEKFILDEGLTFNEDSATIAVDRLTNVQKFFWSPSDVARGIVKFRPLVSQRAQLLEAERGGKPPLLKKFPVMVEISEASWTVYTVLKKED
jgi:hypothetical protein